MRLVILAIAMFALAAGPLVAHAHKVNVFANVEGDRIAVEGYFDDGKRAENATIQVFGPDGEKLLQGKADESGAFSFDIPQHTDLRISLYAGMGHRAEYTVKASELAAVGGTPGGAPVNGAGSAATTGGEAMVAASGAAQAIPPAEMQAMVRQAVGEALNPVMRNLSELKERRTFSDIVGGIGFIVGIIGVFFYVKARKTMDKVAPGGAAR